MTAGRRLLGEPLGAWVVLAGGILAVCAHSASSYVTPVMMKAILAEMHWGRGEFAATSITRTAAVALSGFVWGLSTDRFGARAVLVTGALLAAAGLLAYGALRSLADLYLIGAVIGTGIGALGPVATSTVMTRRFGPRRGLALGLLHGGDNLLNSVIPRTAAALLVAFGWRRALWVIAGVYALVGGIVFVTLGPGEGRAEAEAHVRRGFDLRNLPWRRPELYLVSLVFLVAYAYLGAVMFHLVPYETDRGLSLEEASTTFGYVVLAGFAGSLFAGLGAERRSALAALVVVQSAVTLFSVGLWGIADPHRLRWWAWCHGLASAGYAPLTAMLMGELFGVRARNLGGTIGLGFLMAMVGVYVGNLGSGWGYDVAGSYVPVWRAFTAALALSLVPLGLLVAMTRRRVRAGQGHPSSG